MSLMLVGALVLIYGLVKREVLMGIDGATSYLTALSYLSYPLIITYPPHPLLLTEPTLPLLGRGVILTPLPPLPLLPLHESTFPSLPSLGLGY